MCKRSVQRTAFGRPLAWLGGNIDKIAGDRHGAAGVSGDFPLAYTYAMQRTLRLADGPDEVHRAAVGKYEIGKYVPREMLRSGQ